MAKKKFDLDDALDAHPVQRQRQGIRSLVGDEATNIQPGTETELSLDEQDELQRCEQIVERGLKTFFEVGTALLRVRDLRLYRVEYATFEDYCQARWDMGRHYVNRIIAASQVRETLVTIGTKLPDNEAQARPLSKLPDPAQQRMAWQRAVETAPDGRITAAHVEQVVKQMLCAGELAPPSTPHIIEHEPIAAAPPPPLAERTAPPDDPAALRAEIVALRRRIANVQAIIEEYRQHLPPAHADAVEAASLVRLVERVYTLLREDD